MAVFHDVTNDASGAFDDFYRGTSRRLVRFALGLTGNTGDAQDIVQEAYVRAWQRWSKVGDYESAEAWLRVVVHRLATDRWRRLAVRRLFAAKAPAPGVVPPPSEDALHIMAALRTLPPAQRRAVALHYLLDLSIEQIAEETGAPTGTVKSWLSRGRITMAEALGGERDA